MHATAVISFLQCKMVSVEVCLISCNVISKGTVLLQSCMDFLRIESGSSSETCPASSHDGNQITDINAEPSDSQEVRNLLLIALPGIEPACTVSSMSACLWLCSCHKDPELCTAFVISTCLSFHTHGLSPFH
jgi:hypothetical protein